jgi:hypothetical protein
MSTNDRDRRENAPLFHSSTLPRSTVEKMVADREEAIEIRTLRKRRELDSKMSARCARERHALYRNTLRPPDLGVPPGGRKRVVANAVELVYEPL